MRKLSSVLGNSQRLDGGAMFGNAPKALWSRWAESDEANRIRLACRALLWEEAGRTILFETGIGAFFPPKLRERYGVQESEHVLLQSLAALELGPEDIDAVVLSHLHFDHAGGLLSHYEEGKPAALVFPRAEIIVGKVAWERAMNPDLRDRASFIPDLMKLLDGNPKLRLVEEHEHLFDGLRFIASDGHTPGMLMSEIEMPTGPVVFAADLIPGCPWVHLPITMGYDRFAERVIQEKKALLEALVERDGKLFYTHDPLTALSGVFRGEQGAFRAVGEKESLVRWTGE